MQCNSKVSRNCRKFQTKLGNLNWFQGFFQVKKNPGLFQDFQDMWSPCNFKSSTIEEFYNYLRICWNKCLETPSTLIAAFKIKILNGEKWKTERLATLEYFSNKLLEEDQTDDNASINSSDAIRSNKVKIISSENNHTLIWKFTGNHCFCNTIKRKMWHTNLTTTRP